MLITDLTTLSADSLLAVAEETPEQLFVAEEEQAKRQWRELSGYWHPDRNNHAQAKWVFSHVQNLYRAACEKRSTGIWDEPGVLSITTTDDRHYRLRHTNQRDLDLGKMYIGRNTMAYVIEHNYADLARHAYTLIDALPFADAAMRSAMTRFLPEPRAYLETGQASVLVLNKSERFVALSDLLRFARGVLPPKHVAWIVSALLNLVCYLEAVGLAHHAIEPDHILVAPQEHALALAGGWWFALPQDAPLLALPARSARLAPPDVLHRKLADVRLDQFLLRATALELLGDEVDATPEPMRCFLELPPAGCALEDYERWQQVLWDSFGERRFIPLAISPDDIYQMAS